MGVYNVYENCQVAVYVKGRLDIFKVGDDCDLNDGIYLDYKGAIVILNGKLIAEFPHIKTKWQDKLDSKKILDSYNPVKIVVTEIDKLI